MAYFAFMQRQDQEFIFEVTDSAMIQKARDILSGKEKFEVHVHGRLVKRRQPYNPKWDFHMDPATVRFFAMAIEICDADMSYVQEHLDEVGGAFLPGGHWCPWNSRLVREVTP